MWALAVILLFRARDAMMFAMVAPFRNHLGYGLMTRGILTGTVVSLLPEAAVVFSFLAHAEASANCARRDMCGGVQ